MIRHRDTTRAPRRVIAPIALTVLLLAQVLVVAEAPIVDAATGPAPVPEWAYLDGRRAVTVFDRALATTAAPDAAAFTVGDHTVTGAAVDGHAVVLTLDALVPGGVDASIAYAPTGTGDVASADGALAGAFTITATSRAPAGGDATGLTAANATCAEGDACRAWTTVFGASEDVTDRFKPYRLLPLPDGTAVLGVGQRIVTHPSGHFTTSLREGVSVASVDPVTGTPRWAWTYDRDAEYTLVQDVALDANATTLFLAGRTGWPQGAWFIRALDTGTGLPRWSTTAPAGDYYQVPVALTISPDGRTMLVTGSVDEPDQHRVIALDATDGAERWRLDFSAPEHARHAALSPDGRTLYYLTGYDAWHVTAVDVVTRAVTWQVTLGVDVEATQIPANLAVTPDGERVVVTGRHAWPTSEGGSFVGLYATSLAAHDGTVQWGRGVNVSTANEGTTLGPGVLSPDGTALYVTGAQPSPFTTSPKSIVARLSTDTGAASWTWEEDHATFHLDHAEVTGDGSRIVLFGASDAGHASVRVLDASTGTLVWRADVPAATVRPHVAGTVSANGTWVFVTANGTAWSSEPGVGTVRFPNHAPVARAIANVTHVNVSDAVTFNASTSTDPDTADHIVNWSWSVDDATFAWGETASWTPRAAGEQCVTLTVTDRWGATATEDACVDVAAAPPDLVVTIPRVTDAAMLESGYAIANVTVRNDGASATEATTLALTVNGGAATSFTVPALEAGAAAEVSILQPALPGTQRYAVTVDPAHAVTESDETNNGDDFTTSLATVLPCADGTAGCLLGVNLILNPGADEGAGGSWNDLDVPYWDETGQFTALRHAHGQLGEPAPAPGDADVNLFVGGSVALSRGEQTLDVSRIAGAIDAGVEFELSGWLGGWRTQNDRAALTITFRDDAGDALATAAIGPVLSADRGGQTGILYRETSGVIPEGTRAIHVALEMVRTSGSHNDGYADSLSLVLQDHPPVLDLPDPLNVPQATADGTVVTFDVTATDVTDGTLTPTCSPASGAVFPPGATTVACEATDGAGNTATGSFTVTVEGQPDLRVEIPRLTDAELIERGYAIETVTVRNAGTAASPETRLNMSVNGEETSGFAVPALAAGENVTLGVHEDTASGLQRYVFTIDPADLVAESDESNNVDDFTTFLLPNLRLETGVLPLAQPGEYVEWDTNVTNAGNFTAYDVLVRMTAPVITTDENVGTLTPGQTKTVRMGYRVSDPPPYPATFTVDPEHAVAESDETDNALDVRLWNGTLPDLTVRVTDVPDDVVRGSQFFVDATVTNNGGGASAATTFELFLDDVWHDAGNVPALEPGETATLRLGPDADGAGTLTYRVHVDARGAVEEWDEGNNNASFTVRLPELPNLVLELETAVTAFTLPEGETLTLAAFVNNTGDAASPATSVYVLTCPECVEASVPVPPLEPGDGVRVDLPFGPARLDLSDWSAMVDTWGGVDESDESDNAIAISLTAERLAPDLSLNATNVPNAVARGDAFAPTLTVTNGGGSAAATVLRITVNGAAVGEIPVDALAAGGTVTFRSPVDTTPFPPGTYEVTATVVPVADETVTTNNAVTRSVTVLADGAFDLAVLADDAFTGTISEDGYAFEYLVVRNAGTRTAPPSTLTWQPPGVEWSSSKQVDAVAPGETVRVRVREDGPHEGTYTYAITLDTRDGSVDPNPANNVLELTVTAGDGDTPPPPPPPPEEAPPAAPSADTMPPAWPADARAWVTDVTRESARLHWNATATDENTSVRYWVFLERPDALMPRSYVGVASAPPFTLDGLEPDSAHEARVVAVDELNNHVLDDGRLASFTTLPPNAPPTGGISGPDAALVDEPVAWQAMGFDVEGRITTLGWRVDDVTGDEATFTHAFTAPGMRTLTLTLTDDEGAVTVVTRDVEIRANDCRTGGDAPAHPTPASALTARITRCSGAFEDDTDRVDAFGLIVPRDAQGGTVHVTVETANGRLEACLLQPEAHRACAVATGDSPAVLHAFDVPPGEWSLALRNLDAPATYRLTVHVAGPHEDCGTAGDAGSTRSGSTRADTEAGCDGRVLGAPDGDDADWYAVDARAGDLLTVSLRDPVTRMMRHEACLFAPHAVAPVRCATRDEPSFQTTVSDNGTWRVRLTDAPDVPVWAMRDVRAGDVLTVSVTRASDRACLLAPGADEPVKCTTAREREFQWPAHEAGAWRVRVDDAPDATRPAPTPAPTAEWHERVVEAGGVLTARAIGPGARACLFPPDESALPVHCTSEDEPEFQWLADEPGKWRVRVDYPGRRGTARDAASLRGRRARARPGGRIRHPILSVTGGSTP